MIQTMVVRIAIQLVESYEFATLQALTVLDQWRNRKSVESCRIAVKDRGIGGFGDSE